MTRLFIANIAFKAQEDAVRDLFVDAGYLPDGVRLITDRKTGESKGYAFAEFRDDQTAQHAIEDLDGQMFLGRKLVVRVAGDHRERAGDRREARERVER